METTLKTQKRYKVVKIMRISGRREVIRRNITELETAQNIVKSYPNSTRSIVLYYSY